MPPRTRRKPKPLPTVKLSSDPQVKRFVQARTKDTRLIGKIDRMLVEQQREEEQQGHENYRGPGVLHPSEISKRDWCPRSSWWRIKRFREGVLPPPEIVSMRLEAIFQEGHEVHGKWQSWAWSTGTLAGMYDCLRCDHLWWGLSPSRCPNCDGGRKRLRYREVPVDGYDEFLIEGKADGLLVDPDPDLTDSILEIKSMSQGTVRTEWLEGLTKNTKEFIDTEGREHKWIDLDQLWRDIKFPFPSHLVQGNIYARIRGVDWLTYIYENKINQGHKEISVKTSEMIWGPVLSKALEVKVALVTDVPPDCPKNGCKHCKPYEEDSHASPTPARANGARGPRAVKAPAPPRARLPRAHRPAEAAPDTHHARRPAALPRLPRSQGDGGTGASGPLPAAPAVRRLPRAPHRSDDVERLRPDAGDALLHGVGRLPRRPALTL